MNGRRALTDTELEQYAQWYDHGCPGFGPMGNQPFTADAFRELLALRASLTASEKQARLAMHELACLIPVPSDPELSEWPCENPADRECLHKAYTTLRALLAKDEP